MTGLEAAVVTGFAPLAIQGLNYTCAYAKEKYDSLKNLEEKLDLLKEIVEGLRARKNDWEAEVQKNKTKTVTHCYSNWKSKASNIIIEAESLICTQNKIPSKWHFRKRKTLTAKMARKCDKILELLQQSDFPNGILVDKPAEPVLKLNAPNIKDFPTLQGPLEQILDWLENEKIKAIGICGFVGVGKTTVMQNLNNHEEVAKRFDIVLWLKVGSEGNEEKLRGLIAQRLKLNVDDIPDPATGISEELKGRKYLLMLDDVVNCLDLETMGVLESNNGSKVVLTTRFSDVCNSMVDKVIKMGQLSEDETWRMFRKIVGDNVIHGPDIAPEAMKVANNCAGLPLLITKVASSFKFKTSVEVWRNSLNNLILWPQIGNEGLQELYRFLTICYNELQPDYRKFFLYGALYPAERKIYTDYLVECWACQGFLGNNGNSRKYQDVRDEGVSILDHLTDVLLLEKDERMICVWMNNCIRQVALYILSRDDSDTKILIETSKDVRTNVEHWHEAEQISMIDVELRDLPESKDCTILSTVLLLQRTTELTKIDKFFVNMERLRVLDLCGTGIVMLPSSISGLKVLKGLYLNGCHQLIMLPPEMGTLPLEVLDIRGSRVPFFPHHMRQLIHLRCLRTSYNKISKQDDSQIRKIICSGKKDDSKRRINHNGKEDDNQNDVISNLTGLEELMIDLNDEESYDQWCNEVEDVIRQVNMLKNLTTLRLCFPNLDMLNFFLENSQSWRVKQQITSFRFFIGCQTSKRPEILQCFDYKIKRYLKYYNGECNDNSINCNLLTNTLVLDLIGHKDIETLSKFEGIASMNEIRGFRIEGCETIIKILNGNDTKSVILPNLEQLYLTNLPNLKSIFEGSFESGSLSKLQILELKSCKMLAKIFSNGVFQQLLEVQKLIVEDCDEIEELIVKPDCSGSNSDVLPKLKTLNLSNMPKLKTICSESLVWPSLAELKIHACPELKKFPFSRGNATKLRAIEGEQQWWDGLQCESKIKEELKKICTLR